MIESIAWAMATQPVQGKPPAALDVVYSVLPLVLIIVVFYFLIVAPQKKKSREHKDMLSSLKKGDKVVTAGGEYGVIESVGEKTVILKIAENVKVKYGRGYIVEKRGTSEDD
ncbi:MAG: preprotein translocase subunit YajC [Candidatus Magnetoovum sp. WYHC-5]|nr:preprotein translocase subunit YajC [Candidatus Magnetoovum sp. WYHC-5]